MAVRKARININPVAGLQLAPQRLIMRQPWPESTSTQSRDYNGFQLGYLLFQLCARININPVAGLQLGILGMTAEYIATARININPVAGLQLQDVDGLPRTIMARININPVAGLQRAQEAGSGKRGTKPESTSTQSRDYNFAHGLRQMAHDRPESTSTQSRDYNMQ